MNNLQERIRGSLIGGAIGDALGYPVEFMSLRNILHKYGEGGIRRFQEFDRNRKAVVSDDTQMTLFTANGLLFGVTRLCTHGGLGAGLKDFVAYAYQDWLQTQTGVEDYYVYHYCWIRDISELNVRRAPGNTCMSALMSLKEHEKVENDSKGCGGVMRVAPVGWMAAADEQTIVRGRNGVEAPRRKWPVSEIVRLGGDCAEITHKHPLGYLPAAFMADLVYYILMNDEPITFGRLESFIDTVRADVKREYTTEREQKALDELWALIEKAIRLAAGGEEDHKAVSLLGEGWTGEEALAIAIYCTLRHLDSFEESIAAAVNHDGDSDSTGAICGNLMGAIVGYGDIPSPFTSRLEMTELMLDMADDIVKGCPLSEYHSPSSPEEHLWERRYVKIEPVATQRSDGSYKILPQALRTLQVSQVLKKLDSSEDVKERCRIGYDLALKVFDTETFDPLRALPSRRLCNEPFEYFNRKDVVPAYFYDWDENNHHVFRLNNTCFEGKGPVVAVRDNLDCRRTCQLKAGLVKHDDKSIMEKYPGWEFYRLDPSTTDGNHAVFTKQLDKGAALEVAHLWEDGTLHRIYYLLNKI